jgi:hypothetical protein
MPANRSLSLPITPPPRLPEPCPWAERRCSRHRPFGSTRLASTTCYLSIRRVTQSSLVERVLVLSAATIALVSSSIERLVRLGQPPAGDHADAFPRLPALGHSSPTRGPVKPAAARSSISW